MQQYVVKPDSEVEDLKEAHEDSLVAHLASHEEAEKNKDEAEKYKLQWINAHKQLERQHSARNPLNVLIKKHSLPIISMELFKKKNYVYSIHCFSRTFDLQSTRTLAKQALQISCIDGP